MPILSILITKMIGQVIHAAFKPQFGELSSIRRKIGLDFKSLSFGAAKAYTKLVLNNALTAVMLVPTNYTKA